MRGQRIEMLQLIAPDGTRRTLASWKAGPREDRMAQSTYAVAPHGAYTAFLTSGFGGRLKLVDASGAIRVVARGVSSFRFSPGGDQLAIVANGEVALVDPATLARRTLATLAHVVDLAWVRGGVVVLTGIPDAYREQVRTITYLPLEGTARVVSSTHHHVSRMMAASRGTRVAWFTTEGLFFADVLDPAPPRRVADFDESLVTAEMAPDGSSVVYAADNLFRVTDDKKERIARGMMFDLWFSDDGATLAYAWLDNAAIRSGTEVHLFQPHPSAKRDVETLRFRRDQPGMLVVRAGDILAWDPATGHSERLARGASAGSTATVLDADVFRGGVVAWVSSPDANDPARSEN